MAVADQRVTYHSMQLVLLLLQDEQLVDLPASLGSLCQTLCMCSVECAENDGLRSLAVRSLGRACTLDRELARQQLPLLYQIVTNDTRDVKQHALTAIVDCVVKYTFDSLAVTTSSVSKQRLLNTIAATLDNASVPSVLAQVAELICRLFNVGELVSAPLLAKFVVKYQLSLSVERLATLCASINAFLARFACSSRANQRCVEEAFVHMLRIVLASTTPHINVERSAKYMIKLIGDAEASRCAISIGSSNKKQKQRERDEQTSSGLANVAKLLSDEMLIEQDAFKRKSYLKVLQLVESSDSKLVQHTALDTTEQQSRVAKSTPVIKKTKAKRDQSKEPTKEPTKEPKINEEKTKKKQPTYSSSSAATASSTTPATAAVAKTKLPVPKKRMEIPPIKLEPTEPCQVIQQQPPPPPTPPPPSPPPPADKPKSQQDNSQKKPKKTATSKSSKSKAASTDEASALVTPGGRVLRERKKSKTQA